MRVGTAMSTIKSRRRTTVSSASSAFVMPGMLERRSRAFDYERVNNVSSSKSAAQVERRPPRPVKLGGKSHPKISRLQGVLGSPTNLFSKLWASYGRLRDTAKQTNVNVYDLFVGNQMLCHLTASPVKRTRTTTSAITLVTVVAPVSAPRMGRAMSKSGRGGSSTEAGMEASISAAQK